ncbi:MAG: PEP/pyruvate-binding domain-containing protein [Nannocystaceae bacterium]
MSPARQDPTLVRALEDLDLLDAGAVGEKAADLGRLTRLGFAVPPGFCITRDAFAAFVNQDRHYGDLCSDLRNERHDTTYRNLIAARIRRHLLERALPTTLAHELREAWTAIGQAHRYALCSSTAAESPNSTSAAGQRDAALNLVSLDDILLETRQCWASAYDDRAVAHRERRGLLSQNLAPTVVVQRMVMADRSGVMFTADPSTGHRHTLAIHAVYGLGEARGTNLSAADRYQTDKRVHALTRTDIGKKIHSTRARRDGGVYTVEVAAARRDGRVLNDAEVEQLSRLGAAIEDAQAKPQRISWRLERNKAWIVETRPITTLFPLPHPPPDDADEHVHVCLQHIQVMTDAMPPLSCSAWSLMLPLGRPRRRVQPSPWVTFAGGRVYVDLSRPLRSAVPRRVLIGAMRHVDALGARAMELVCRRASFTRGPRLHIFWLAKIALPMALRTAFNLLRPDAAKVATKATLRVEALVEDCARRVPVEFDAGERLSRIRLLLGTLLVRLLWLPPLIFAGIVAGDLLRRLVRASEDDFAALGRGLPADLTIHMDRELGDLAERIRGDALLRATFDATRAPHLLRHAIESSSNVTVSTAWSHFVARYGARASSEIDPSRPRWKEEPALLMHTIASHVQQAPPGSQRRQHADLAARAKHIENHMVSQAARARFGWLRSLAVGHLICVHRHLLTVREHPQHVVVHALALLREAALDVGRTMSERGQLESIDDVWFLELDELLDAYNHPRRKLRGRIQRRKTEHERHQQLAPPRVLTSDGESPEVSHPRVDAPKGALIGSPVSRGDVVGRARIVLNPIHETVRPGEILVAPFADPGWTPLFLNASGLVMEVGGQLTHGSVVAREYGIPAVVCVANATKRIRTGQRIRVEGAMGFVEIMDGGFVRAQEPEVATVVGRAERSLRRHPPLGPDQAQ